jgi:hypothetical protein
MTIADDSRPAGDKRVRDHILKALRNQGVKQPPSLLACIPHRAVALGLPGHASGAHSAEDVTGYLQEIGRTAGLWAHVNFNGDLIQRLHLTEPESKFRVSNHQQITILGGLA